MAKHKVKYYQAVDAVILTLLENNKYLKSKRSAELTKFVSEQIGCSTRQAQRYIREARQEVLRIGREKKNATFLKALLDREYLLEKAKAVSDYKLALQIVQDRDKLLGMYVDKIEHKIELPKMELNKLNKEQLKRIANVTSEEELIKLINEFGIATN